MAGGSGVTVLGVYVTDLAFKAARQPAMGETLAGSGFAMGPGGKGSNQSVAAARCGAEVRFVTRLGNDAFGDIARRTWAQAGVEARVTALDDQPTGAAYIFVDERSGDNAIIVVPGAASTLCAADLDAAAADIAGSRVFLTQLEQPMEAARRGLSLAREHGVITVLNPAPAEPLAADIYPLCDYLTPNETEAAALTGIAVDGVESARKAAAAFLDKGVGCALITLGEAGVLLHSAASSEHLPAFDAGPVVETTGAGDAFNGGFAAALARGEDARSAARFGCAVAAISVTRPGTAPSMPSLDEVQALLRAN